jgi:hypothetical protein
MNACIRGESQRGIETSAGIVWLAGGRLTADQRL